MFQNLWENTTFYCGNHHATPTKLVYRSGVLSMSMFYACPKYYPENLEQGEHICCNRLNFVDAEGILDKLTEMVQNDEKNNIFRSYENVTFEYKKIKIKILKFLPGKTELEIFNGKSLVGK